MLLVVISYIVLPTVVGEMLCQVIVLVRRLDNNDSCVVFLLSICLPVCLSASHAPPPPYPCLHSSPPALPLPHSSSSSSSSSSSASS